MNTDLTPCYAISSYAVSDFSNFQESKRTERVTFLNKALNFFLRELKRNETKVVEEYCWAITQADAADQVPLCWSLDFKWTRFYVHTVNPMYTQLRLKPSLPESNYRAIRRVSVWPGKAGNTKLRVSCYEMLVLNFNEFFGTT
jgi:hypothetical protein